MQRRLHWSISTVFKQKNSTAQKFDKKTYHPNTKTTFNKLHLFEYERTKRLQLENNKIRRNLLEMLFIQKPQNK